MKWVAIACPVVVLGSVLASWIASFATAHGAMLAGPRRYTLLADAGMIQFRQSIMTDIVSRGWNAWSVAEVGFQPGGKPYRIQWTPRGSGPRPRLAQTMLFQQVEVLVGGRVPEPSTGRLAPVGERTIIYAVPHWTVALVLAAPVAWWIVSWRRRATAQRRAAGFCVACGYDLRASPQRCPECGTVRAVVQTLNGGHRSTELRS